MVDVTAGQGVGGARPGLLSLTEIVSVLKRGDIALALGILTILVVLILPLPAIVLDLFLAISITLSILILMTSLFIQAPLEFSAFPTILLISTMLRLSLNMALRPASSCRTGMRARMPPVMSSRPSAAS
ncbi:flagellar biosynthesis component FlhA [Bradyrhizobium sp. LM2.7]